MKHPNHILKILKPNQSPPCHYFSKNHPRSDLGALTNGETSLLQKDTWKEKWWISMAAFNNKHSP